MFSQAPGALPGSLRDGAATAALLRGTREGRRSIGGVNRVSAVLLVSGSTRAGSVNTAVLRTVREVMGEEVRGVAYEGMARLPHFNPDDDHAPLPAEVAGLRAAIAAADAVLFCTPEYAGDLPGSLKNLLDWTVGGVEISGTPCGWINASTAPTGARGAHRALRTVLTYTDARVVDAACADVPVPRAVIDAGTGLVTDPAVREQIAGAVRALVADAGSEPEQQAASAGGPVSPGPYTFQVTVDSGDPHPLADWWAAALGWQVEPSDEEFIRRMVAEGHATQDDTTTHRGALVWKAGAAIRHPAGLDRAPRVLFQRVPEGKTVKNRMHLDVRTGEDDPEAVVARLVAAGAQILHEGRQGPSTWTTLRDPQGNEFCVSH